MTIQTTNTNSDSTQLVIFDYGNVKVRNQTDTHGETWWVAKDVCAILGFTDHVSAVRNHLDEDEKGVLSEHTPGGQQELLSVNESGLYTLIFKSSKQESRPFRKWVTSEVLPEIRKMGKYESDLVPAIKSDVFQCQLLGAKIISEMLNYSDTSKISIVSKVYEINNVDSSFLPAYIEKVKIVLSATELLKRNDCELKVRAFNLLLIAQGFLEEKSRPSTGGKTKTFKALTEKGLGYGQNDVSPKNNLEVQPHFFEESFMGLYHIVTED